MTAVAVAFAVVGAALVVVGHRRVRNGTAETNAALLVGIFLLTGGLSYLTRWLW